MAHFTLHYILFSVIKLINPHVLLTESFSLIWSSSQEVDNLIFNNQTSINNGLLINKRHNGTNHTESGQATSDFEFLYTHLGIYLISIATLITSSLNTLKRVDKQNNHREYLINSFGFGILFKIIYIYTINTIADSNIEAAPTSLKTIHTLVLFSLISGFQWSHSNIGAISDTLAVDYCMKHSKPLGVHYNFINYLMFSTFGLAVFSVCLFDGYLIRASLVRKSDNLKFTNVLMTITLLCFILEFLCLLMFTDNNQEKKRDGMELKFSKNLKLPLNSNTLADYYYRERATKEVYSLNDNSIEFPISLFNQNHKFNAAVDEDEVDLFYIHSIPSSRGNDIQEDIAFQNTKDEFDRNKYSLYEDFCLESKKERSFSPNLRIDSAQVKICRRIDNLEVGRGFNKMSALDILISGDLEFIKKVVALSIIGAFYQANQICVLSEYILYIVHRSSKELEDYILSETATSFISSNDFQHGLEGYLRAHLNCRIIWIELLCLSHLIQCSARIVCLQYVHSILTKFGMKNSLLGLLFACPLLIIQFTINYHLLQNKILNLSDQYLTIAVTCQLMIIQIQIGFASALIDYVINDLTLQLTQLIKNLRAGSSELDHKRELANETVRCTVYGILSASFFHIGSVLMIASMLLVNLFARIRSGRYQEGSCKISIFLAIVPVSSLLYFTGVLYMKWRRLKGQRNL